MREEILLDYLWRPNIVIAACSIFKEEKKKYLTTYEEL
jgi:hypothetical protein